MIPVVLESRVCLLDYDTNLTTNKWLKHPKYRAISGNFQVIILSEVSGTIFKYTGQGAKRRFYATPHPMPYLIIHTIIHSKYSNNSNECSCGGYGRLNPNPFIQLLYLSIVDMQSC
jgi:hypothetical protein